jgi:hypothetical protein
MAALMFLSMFLADSPWPDSVVTIHLEFDPGQWEYACAHPEQEILVDAGISIGSWHSDCTMQIRGQTSAYYPKKSVKVRILGGESFCGFDEFQPERPVLRQEPDPGEPVLPFHGACGQITPPRGLPGFSSTVSPRGPICSWRT